MASIEIFNTNGHVLINDFYENFSLASKQSAQLVLASSDPSVTGCRMYVNYAGRSDSSPIVAIGLTENNQVSAVVTAINRSGNTFTFEFQGPNADAGKTVDIYIFDRTSEVVGNGLVQVWRESPHRKVFDSDMEWMRVVDAPSFPYSNSPDGYYFNIDQFRQYAVVYASLAALRENVAFPNQVYWVFYHGSSAMLGRRVNATTLQFRSADLVSQRELTIEPIQDPPTMMDDQRFSSPGHHLLLDVTGM